MCRRLDDYDTDITLAVIAIIAAVAVVFCYCCRYFCCCCCCCFYCCYRRRRNYWCLPVTLSPVTVHALFPCRLYFVVIIIQQHNRVNYFIEIILRRKHLTIFIFYITLFFMAVLSLQLRSLTKIHITLQTTNAIYSSAARPSFSPKKKMFNGTMNPPTYNTLNFIMRWAQYYLNYSTLSMLFIDIGVIRRNGFSRRTRCCGFFFWGGGVCNSRWCRIICFNTHLLYTLYTTSLF